MKCIHYSSLSAMPSPLHSSTSQELFKKYVCIKVATMKNTDSATRPSCLKLQYPFPFSISYLKLVTQQYCLKSTSVIKVATMKNTNNFCYAKEAIICNHQISTFLCQQRWNTKEDTGKSLKNALHVL